MARIGTPYGDIFTPDGPCTDDYPNITVFDDAGQIVKLQDPALRSFKDAERRYAELTRPKHKTRTIVLTGSWRSCAYQAQLYASDHNRYAEPSTTKHTRGLAIDVSTAQPNQEIIRRILAHRGWHQSRPDDEPWHFSFEVTG